MNVIKILFSACKFTKKYAINQAKVRCISFFNELYWFNLRVLTYIKNLSFCL